MGNGAQYFVERGDRRFGPYSSSELKVFSTDGTIKETDVIVDSMSGKKSLAGQVKGLGPFGTKSADQGREKCGRCNAVMSRVLKKGVVTGERWCPACDITPRICPACKSTLQTHLAEQCLKCGRSWHREDVVEKARSQSSPPKPPPAKLIDEALDEHRLPQIDQHRLPVIDEHRLPERHTHPLPEKNFFDLYEKRMALTKPLRFFTVAACLYWLWMAGEWNVFGFLLVTVAAMVINILYVFPWVLFGTFFADVFRLLVFGEDDSTIYIFGVVGLLLGVCMEGITAVFWKHKWIDVAEFVASVLPRIMTAFCLLCLVPLMLVQFFGYSDEYVKAWQCVFTVFPKEEKEEKKIVTIRPPGVH